MTPLGHDDEIGGLANLNGSDQIAQANGSRAVDRRQREYLVGPQRPLAAAILGARSRTEIASEAFTPRRGLSTGPDRLTHIGRDRSDRITRNRRTNAVEAAQRNLRVTFC